MLKVGAFEAKTHLSALLARVARGEEVLITRRGKPVARLVPAEQGTRAGVAAATRELRNLDDGLRLKGIEWRELRDGGRR
ncbi:MAG: type II toxin-antitoxin system Phd/YefM family antitoxin [Gemmatimonadetes bacterium]|nr:type II toxin-antitoxin system Phd/YefM family antitoxin [Gemmatimonadota bacterium]MYA10522.1 type II toxin-antitoxin system Phd/YefM family antitoxin [Gemmatimonadota bacterium]MYD12402.1 type II toxin-antitoxin system Phd/YefM family antitoxin [Gemmatimonadota bacterium]MYE68733.1 type II toxin-antitoxin system Phd/YefM family antitoxin [Gemmatimonadota bacterium]MYI65182.1 type II toxin-antitoxin system Phd/YefM family antitoxin [Gemmatimonadota bacterium]